MKLIIAFTLFAFCASTSASTQDLPQKIFINPDERCSICLNDDDKNQKYEILNCGHCFHHTCMCSWSDANSKAKCPTCKADLNQCFEVIDPEKFFSSCDDQTIMLSCLKKTQTNKISSEKILQIFKLHEYYMRSYALGLVLLSFINHISIHTTDPAVYSIASLANIPIVFESYKFSQFFSDSIIKMLSQQISLQKLNHWKSDILLTALISQTVTIFTVHYIKKNIQEDIFFGTLVGSSFFLILSLRTNFFYQTLHSL